MKPRQQQTVARPGKMHGIGFFSNRDINLEFHPAPENHGIRFQRSDLPNSEPIPALATYGVQNPRRTVISDGTSQVELTEHVMAALAGLQIDNCLVILDGPEPPGMDGSAYAFAEELLRIGVVPQEAAREVLSVRQTIRVRSADGRAEIVAEPSDNYMIRYELDYRHPDLPPQSHELTITPNSFMEELSASRTFILEQEIAGLQAMGIGLRQTAQDLLVIGSAGPIDNAFRFPNECARHKVLDCLGDFALIGCDIQGKFTARRSGHALNLRLVRELISTHRWSQPCIREVA